MVVIQASERARWVMPQVLCYDMASLGSLVHYWLLGLSPCFMSAGFSPQSSGAVAHGLSVRWL